MKDLTLCVVCVILGILLSTIFKQMCGCKNNVEGMHALWHGSEHRGPHAVGPPPGWTVEYDEDTDTWKNPDHWVPISPDLKDIPSWVAKGKERSDQYDADRAQWLKLSEHEKSNLVTKCERDCLKKNKCETVSSTGKLVTDVPCVRACNTWACR
jgi:hypothetical protein